MASGANASLAILRGIRGRIIGIGFRPEHVKLPEVPPRCKHRSPGNIVVKLALKGTPLKVLALISRRVPNGLS